MPQHCSAFSCKTRRTVQSKAQGITFHKFPNNAELRRKWDVAVRIAKFPSTKSSVLCSQHFQEKDFDRTGQIVRLRDGVIPYGFSLPGRSQRPRKPRTTRTSQKAREILSVTPRPEPETSASLPQPQVTEKSRTTNTSKEAEEVLSVASRPEPETSASLPQPQVDHCYALPGCLDSLKAIIDRSMERVESLEKERQNANARVKRAKIVIQCVLQDLRKKNILNKKLQQRLNLYSGRNGLLLGSSSKSKRR